MSAPRPRKVTILIDSLLGGGAERVAVETATRLDPERYIPHLLVTRHSGPLEQIARDHGLAYTILERRRGFHPRAFLRARSLIGAGDLLHAHKFEGSLWGVLLSRSARRPLVAHEHTFDGRRSRLRTVGYRYLIAPTARKIICVSASVAASLEAEGVSRQLIEVVPNGVSIETLGRDAARAELGLTRSQLVIGMIGRLRQEKRHDLALEALALLRSENRDVMLCCLGDGPQLEELVALARRLGIEAHIHWAGEVADAGRLAGAFDVAVLCSDYEGMPLAALEVLVAGVPLIATAVGSLPDLLADGGGTVVPRDDAPALAHAVAAVLDNRDPERYRESQRRAREQFGLARAVQNLQHVYDEALA